MSVAGTPSSGVVPKGGGVDCSKLLAAIARLALNIGTHPEVKSLADVTARMQEHIPEITHGEVVRAIVETTTGHQRAVDEITAKLADLKREAKSDKGLREKIDALKAHLEAGTAPEAEPAQASRASATVEQLRGLRDDLKKWVGGSEPAVKQRLAKQIDALTERLESSSFAPKMKLGEGPASKEIQRLTYERDRLRREINQRIADLKPKTFGDWAQEPSNLARNLALGIDFGQVLRQGKFALVSHPILTVKNLRPMLQAFARDGAEARIMEQIEGHPDAALAHRAGLDLTQGRTTGYKGEEIFRGLLADRVPGLGRFNSAYRTFLNKLRFDLFSAAKRSLGRNGEMTLPEATVIANAINVSTGRGAVRGSFKNAMVAAGHLFTAPQYQISRFQWMIGQPLWGGGAWRGSGRARVYVAKEYARTLVGLGVYYSLLNLAGSFMATDDAERPTMEFDPRSSDFGKVKIGDTRIDPLAGVAQWATFAARMFSGETKTATGAVRALRGPAHQFGKQDAVDVATRFFRGRLSPLPGAVWDKFVAGKTADNQEPTALRLLANAFTPVTPKEILSNMQDEGMERGTALGIMSLFGEGVQRYQRKPDGAGPP